MKFRLIMLFALLVGCTPIYEANNYTNEEIRTFNENWKNHKKDFSEIARDKSCPIDSKTSRIDGFSGHIINVVCSDGIRGFLLEIKSEKDFKLTIKTKDGVFPIYSTEEVLKSQESDSENERNINTYELKQKLLKWKSEI